MLILLDGQHGSYYRAYANLTGTPTIPSLSGYATESYVGTQISNLVDSSPAALNTLNELAAAIGDDASFSTTVTNNIATKLPKAGGTMTGKLIAPRISINRSGTAASGYNYYSETLNTWQTYMSPAGQTSAGYNGNLTAPSGTYVTSWAIRSVVEPIAGYGWTWEELANSATTGQSVIAELSSNTGNFKTIGNMYASGGNSTQWNTAYGWGNHASAGYTNDQTAAEILTAIKTVDGSGSGLDADLLDGQQGSYYYAASNPSGYTTNTGTLTSETLSSTNGGVVVTGTKYWQPAGTATSPLGGGGSASLQAYTTGTTAAYMAFHRSGAYAINWGLDTSNTMVLGGWSSSTTAARMSIGTNGLMVTAGQGILWGASNDGSGSGLDADLLDGANSSVFFKSPSNVSGWQNNNANFSVRSGSSSAGLHMEESDGTFAFQLYGDSGSYGFLDAEWAGWDIQKVVNGTFKVDEGAGLKRVLNEGNWTSYITLPTAATLTGTTPTGAPFLSNFVHLGTSTTTGYATDDGSWGSRLNVSSTVHAKIEVSQEANSMRSAWYAHTGQTGIKFGTLTSHVVDFITAGTVRMSIPNNSGLVTTTGQGTLWGSSNDGSGSGLDADLLDGMNATDSRAGNTIVMRQANGYMQAMYVNTTDDAASTSLGWLYGRSFR